MPTSTPNRNVAAALDAQNETSQNVRQAGANSSQQTQLPKPAAHLNDFAEAVEETTRQRLEKVLENLEQKTGVKFVVVTIKTADAKDLYDYSLQLANDWNVGAPASRDKSVLLLITSENGKFFIQASRPVRAYLPDGLIGEMALRLRPKLDAGSYNDGLLSQPSGSEFEGNDQGGWLPVAVEAPSTLVSSVPDEAMASE